MQRFKVIDDDLIRPEEQPHRIVPDEVFVEVVLATDAEAAIARLAAISIDQILGSDDDLKAALTDAYLQGQRDMVAKCIAALEDDSLHDPDPMWSGTHWNNAVHECKEALRALQEKP